MMKKLIALLFCLVCMGVVAYAEVENGVIFQIEESEFGFLSTQTPEGIKPLGGGFYAAPDMAAAEAFAGVENILSLALNEQFELVDDPAVNDSDYNEQWYLETIGYTRACDLNLTGDGIVVAVVDSGLDADHPDLNPGKILAGYNCLDASEDTDDTYGHGTNVAGIIAARADNAVAIAGIAPNVSILPIKITDGKSVTLDNIILGVNQAVVLGCDIISISVAGAITDAETIAMLKTCIDNAVNAGVIVVAAVGNGEKNTLCYPAAFDNVIGVGAIGLDGVVAENSRKNESVFITAPGEEILTLSHTGSTETVSGTSFAAPMVAAVVALMKEAFPDLSPAEIADWLRAVATETETGEKVYNTSYGYGVLNIPKLFHLRGDFYADSVIDVRDLIRLQQYVANWEIALSAPERFAADSNHDGWIDIEDVFLLAEYLAGWDVPLK